MKSLVHFLSSSFTFLSTPIVVAYSGMSVSIVPGTGSLDDTYRLTVECRTNAVCPRAESLSGITNFSIVSESSISNVVLQNGSTSVLEKNSYQIVPKRPWTFVFSVSGSTASVHVMTGSASQSSTSSGKESSSQKALLLPPSVRKDSTDLFDPPPVDALPSDEAGLAGKGGEVFAAFTGAALAAFAMAWDAYPKTRNALLFLAFLFGAYKFVFRRSKPQVANATQKKPEASDRIAHPVRPFPDESSSAEDCLALVRQNLETRYNMDVSSRSFAELVALESDPHAAELLGRLLDECGRHAYSAARADTTAIRILTIEYLKHVA